MFKEIAEVAIKATEVPDLKDHKLSVPDAQDRPEWGQRAENIPDLKDHEISMPEEKDCPIWGESAEKIPDIGDQRLVPSTDRVIDGPNLGINEDEIRNVSQGLEGEGGPDTSNGEGEKKDVPQCVKNKEDGIRREEEVQKELEEKYPAEDGYKVLSEVYLRDKDGNIVKDPETGEARRIDKVVIDKDGNVVEMVEVTSETAPKEQQTAKENRIRENGGNYVKNPESEKLCKIPDGVVTKIERRA